MVKEGGMEGRGFSRVLIIPVLAAVAIVVIRFWLPEDLWKRSAINVSQVSRHSLPSTPRERIAQDVDG